MEDDEGIMPGQRDADEERAALLALLVVLGGRNGRCREQILSDMDKLDDKEGGHIQPG